MRIGERVKQLRTEKGDSLQTVATAVGVSKAHLSSLELGNSNNPTLNILVNLAEYFDTSVAYLIGEKSNEDPESIAIRRSLKKIEQSNKALIKEILQVLKYHLY